MKPTVAPKLLLPFLLFSTLVLAQTRPAIDSLVNKGKKLIGQDNDQSLRYSYKAYGMASRENYYWGKMNAAQWIAEAYHYKSMLDSSMKYDEIALRLSRAENDLPEIANNLVAKAQTTADLGRREEALGLFGEARQIMEARKDTYDLADLTLRVGGVYLSLDRNGEAMKILSESYRYAKQLDNKDYQAYALSTMSIVQKKIGNFSKAIALANDAHTLFEEVGDEYSTALELNNMGILYKDTRQFVKAMRAYDEAGKIAEKLNYLPLTLGLANNRGILLNLMGKYPEAEKELRKAVGLAKQIGNQESLADAKTNLARSLYRQEKKAEAREQVTESIAIAKEIKSLEKQKDGHQTAEEIYAADGDYRTALSHAVALRTVRDSLFHLEKARQINQLQAQYETAKKDAEIQLLNKNAEIDRNRRLALLVGLVLLALTAAAWIYSLAAKRKKLLAENALERQKRLNAEQQLEFKHKELTAKVLQLARKNEFLTSREEQGAALRNSVEDTVRQTSRRIIRLIKSDIGEDRQWEQFSEEFRSLHKGYMEALTEKHGSLTTNETRLISLLMMNLSSKDIAATLRISNEGISKARYRLRKKLGLDADQDLNAYLTSFMYGEN